MAASAPAPECVFITGAPDSASLDWSSAGLNNFNSAITRFLDGNTTPSPHPEAGWVMPLQGQPPVWRVLPLERQQLETGLTPKAIKDHNAMDWERSPPFRVPGGHNEDYEAVDEPSIFMRSAMSFEESSSSIPSDSQPHSSAVDSEEALSQFYDHSLAFYDAVPLSESPPSIPKAGPPQEQLPNRAIETLQDTSTTDDSFTTASISFTEDPSSIFNASSFLSPPTLRRPNKPAPAPPPAISLPPAILSSPITTLSGIPNSRYLQSINLSTKTVTLLVAILTPPTSQNIRTRQGHIMTLHTLLLGDTTRTGFSLQAWLPPASSPRRKPAETALAILLSRLHPGDVLLARNVALRTFRGEVYGQVLRGQARGNGGLYVLSQRARAGSEEVLVVYSAPPEKAELVEKVREVREWALKFVAPTMGGAGSFGSRAMDDSMPPDTPG